MHICHVNFAKGFRGGERQTALLIQALAKKQISQLLIARYDSPLLEMLAGVSNLSIKAYRKPYLAYLLKGVKADMIHAHEAKAAQWAYLNFLRVGVPYIITRRVPNRQRDHWFNRNIYASAHAVVGLSAAIKSQLKTVVPKLEPEVIPSMYASLGVDESLYKTLCQRYEDKFIVGHVGALVKKHKGQHYLIEAAKRLEQRHPDIHILLLGSGRDEIALKQQASTLSNIEFLGHQQSLGAYYKRFDLFAFPSLEEGLGSSLLDAMDASCPMVGSEVDGIPDIIRHEENGLLVPPADSEVLAEAISRLYLNETLRNRLVTQASKDLPRFSPEIVAQQYYDLYQ